MTISKTIFLFALSLVIGCTGEPPSESIEPTSEERTEPAPERQAVATYIYVGMRTDDRPFFEYEGDGMLRSATVKPLSPEGTSFGFELIAIRLPEGESFVLGGINDKRRNHIVTFTGTVVRSGDDGFALKGDLHSDGAVVLQLVKILDANDSSKNEFPEWSFDAGDNSVEISGNVIGWLEK